MGLRLLADLVHALAVSVEPPAHPRLTEADLPAIRKALTDAGIALTFGPAEETELVRLSDRYDIYLQALSNWLFIPLPPWIPPQEDLEESRTWELPGAFGSDQRLTAFEAFAGDSCRCRSPRRPSTKPSRP